MAETASQPIGPRDTAQWDTAQRDAALVHVIDDDDAVRDSLALLLDAAGIAARTYDSATAFLALAPSLGAGCVLTDVRMPDLDGLALQRKLTEAGVTLPVIVMTGHGDVPIAVAALKAGAADFLEKPFDDERLIATVRTALTAGREAWRHAAAITQIATRVASLTPREREVLTLVVAGSPNKTIAYDLGASPRTIEVHRARVMEKMGARNLAELVRMMIAAPPGDAVPLDGVAPPGGAARKPAGG
jgi:two-component system response regulator FixJ